MKTKSFGLIALLAVCAFTITWCGKSETPVESPEQNAEIANPASVFCEEHGWILNLEDDTWLCMFPDWSYCEEWSYYKAECAPWEIMYNTVSDDVIPENTENISSYSDEDLNAAEATILNVVNNERQVKVESFEVVYAGDEASASELEYCKTLNPEIEECAVFTSSFHIPEQDAVMAWAFEPNTDINGYSWILGRATAWEWEILTNGFG